MKTAILLTVFCLPVFLLSAQDFYPHVFVSPKTGMDQVRNENPYVLILTRKDTAMPWNPSGRYVRIKAPNAPYTGLDIVSYWDTTNEWNDYSQTSNHFVLDAQNRIDTATVYYYYNYVSRETSYQKYVFDYNQQNNVSKINYYLAEPTSPDNYTLQSISYLRYDNSGKRTKDSTLSYLPGGQSYITYYYYDGNNLIEADQLYANGDSLYKYVYTYSGNLISSISRLYLNFSGEWTLSSTDTLEYNSQQQISRRTTAGYSTFSFTFNPLRNEYYQYSTQNKLLQILSYYWSVDQWIESSLVELTYSASGDAEVGYGYSFKDGSWDSVPYTQYLFEVHTGIPTTQKVQSPFSLYPNPASDFLTIETDQSETLLSLYEISGRLCYQQRIQNKEKIDVSALSSGLYYATLTANGKPHIVKVFIQHE